MKWLNENASGIQAVAACLGIIVSGWLTYLVYKVTKKAAHSTTESTAIANAMLQLSKDTQLRSEERELAFRHSMRSHYKNQLIQKCSHIKKTMATTDAREIYNALRDNIFTQTIPMEELSRFFSSEEILSMEEAWKVWDGYIKNYYFPGNEPSMGLLVTNAPYPYEAFDSLEKYLQKSP